MSIGYSKNTSRGNYFVIGEHREDGLVNISNGMQKANAINFAKNLRYEQSMAIKEYKFFSKIRVVKGGV